MHIALLSLTFHLPGCLSLKEKRSRLRGLKDRFGKNTNLAVSETRHHDKHQSAEWIFVALVQERPLAEKLFSSIEDYANTQLDAIVTKVEREWL